MNKKTLPPQAYTRDTVVEAFNWLQNQDEKVRSSVHSTDALVSLYLRTKRFGNALESEAPVSSKDFKLNLKNLARGLQEFEEQSPVPTDLENSAEPTPPASHLENVQPLTSGLEAHMEKESEAKQGSNELPPQMEQLSPELLQKLDEIRSEMRAYVEPQFAATKAPQIPQGMPQQQIQQHSNHLLEPQTVSHSTLQNPSAHTFSVDAQSWNYILRVQGQLNLSSPDEAMKVVIATGARKLLKFLEIRD